MHGELTTGLPQPSEGFPQSQVEWHVLCVYVCVYVCIDMCVYM